MDSQAGLPVDLVVFGARGDLAIRKLFPALYHLDRAGCLPEGSRLIGASRSEFSDESYRQLVEQGLHRFLPSDHLQEKAAQENLTRFLQRLGYERVDGTDPDSFRQLKVRLEQHPQRARVYYFATAPDLFSELSEHLGENGLIDARSRVVLEKPLGRDLASSRCINDAVAKFFGEDQTYRIDHYLGKEAVQNLLVLRFANSLFEPLWNSAHIDNVQITVSETIGVENRWGYYDGAGAMRDMVQNHLLQVLCLVAMEAPASMDADTVRNEKVKVLSALRRFDDREVAQNTVRGQYRAGAIDGRVVPGYLDEEGADPQSRTETYVAIRAAIDNWRWAGVPFYLRTGKRLADRLSEVVIQFKSVPHIIFPVGGRRVHSNRLVIRLQPDEGVKLLMTHKAPGNSDDGYRLRQVPLNLSFAEAFEDRNADAYERLLLDAIRGVSTLFMRRDEVDAAWAWVDDIIAAWQRADEAPRTYPAGSWGPSSAVAMIERENRTWHEDLS